MTEQMGWAATGSGAVYAGLHLPAGSARATAVVLVPPFGWEGVSAGRNLRAWARQLAVAGYPTLRYQPPGAGDSSGAGVEQDLASWSAALADLVSLLRRASGCRFLTVVGLGIGGLVALRSVADGADVDDLVLWAVPGRGRLLLRELRAFAALTAEPGTRQPTAPSELAAPGADGVLWVHGHPLGARAQEDLTALDVSALDLTRVQRALVLGRGTLPVDRQLVETLAATGADVVTGSGRGLDELTVEPRLSRPPHEVMSAVENWLRPDPAGPLTENPEAAPLFPDPLAGQDEQRLVIGAADAVLTGCSDAKLTAVFLSAGAMPRTGPNRLWTEAARRWARLGIASLRVDLHDIGEAAGPDVFPRGPEGLYDESYRSEIAEVLRAGIAAGLPAAFLTVGLCSGGFWAVDTAVRDPRVVAAVSLNGSLVWPPPLSQVPKRAILNHRTMLRLARDAGLRREAARWGTAQLRLAHHRLRQHSGDLPLTPAEVASVLGAQGKILALAASPGEPVLQQLLSLRATEDVMLRSLTGPEGAHTLAPLQLRTQAQAFLDEVAVAALARHSARLAAR